jgi:hypothetical protein
MNPQTQQALLPLKNALNAHPPGSTDELSGLIWDYLHDRQLLNIMSHDAGVNFLYHALNTQEPTVLLVSRNSAILSASFQDSQVQEIISCVLFLSDRTPVQNPGPGTGTSKRSGVQPGRASGQSPSLPNTPKRQARPINWSKPLLVIVLVTGMIILYFVFLHNNKKITGSESTVTMVQLCGVYKGEIREVNKTTRCEISVSIGDEESLKIKVYSMPDYAERGTFQGNFQDDHLKLNGGPNLKVIQEKRHLKLQAKTGQEEWSFVK